MAKSVQALQGGIGECIAENESIPLSNEAARQILGIQSPVPLTPGEMARSLRVAFYPRPYENQRLSEFLRNLTSALMRLGVQVLQYDRALKEGSNGRIGKGIVLIAMGEGEPGNLAIDHVASLSENTVVGILDGSLAGLGENRLQKRLDALVGGLVWHMAHVMIYLDDTSWTVCNMNGAIDTFAYKDLEERILYSLIPKLAAPVVPPKKLDFEVCPDAFHPLVSDFKIQIKDMVEGASAWAKTGLLTSQTKIEELSFRNNRYKRIASAYLNWRTGMSYGFLARQLPTVVEPAVELKKSGSVVDGLDWMERDVHLIGRNRFVSLWISGKQFITRIPPVSVLCTRSGCNKTELDPYKDLVLLTLDSGKISLGTPIGIGSGDDCQPSFDTTAILAHAVGNAMIASILATFDPSSEFLQALSTRGLALAHWHGYVHPSEWPAGYYSHGQNNLPVSCSTPQAAIYALCGKISAFRASLDDGTGYLGDVHEEPSHGTNLTGQSLVQLARIVSAVSEAHVA